MKYLTIWVLMVSSYFFLIVDEGSYIQDVGVAVGCTLMSMLPLFFINWWVYIERNTFSMFILIKDYIPSLASVILPLLMIRKASLIPEAALFAVLLSIVFISVKQDELLWRYRFGDLKELPDEGELSFEQRKRIKYLALTSILFPIVAYFIYGAIYPNAGRLG